MKACIVGYGAIGPIHAESVKCADGIVYGICDIVRQKADMGAEKYGAKGFYSFDDCLADENIDVIHICTPHYLHFEMIKKALDSGKRVVVEKPAVMKKEELTELFKKYDTKSIFPIFQNRANNCIERLKQIINEESDFGILKGIKGIVTWQRTKEYYEADAWRGTKDFEGGGVLINQTLHTLDLMVYFAGRAKNVYASMRNNILSKVIEVEDTLDAYIEFENGAKGIFYATNSYCKNSPVLLELDFENANIKYMDSKLYINGEYICSDSDEYSGKSYWGSGHTKVIGSLYKEESDFCLDDVRDTMETMFAIYESAQVGKKINL